MNTSKQIKREKKDKFRSLAELDRKLDPESPSRYNCVVFNLKRLTQKKKKQYKQNFINKMTDNKEIKNQKTFWKLFNKLDQNKTHNPIIASHDALTDHYKVILTSKRKIIIPPDSNEKGKLDYHFTLEEPKKASHILKANKAPGLDNLSNEMLACFVENYPFLVIKLFNTILDSKKVIPDWSTGMITPIFKRGSTSDPANYKGISLLSCFGKLFMSLLNNRLMDFCIINNIISQNQLGFLPENNLIQKHCHKNKSNIYSCFIDFGKAFDTIPRDKLLQKLLNYNIKRNFLNTIKKIYIYK